MLLILTLVRLKLNCVFLFHHTVQLDHPFDLKANKVFASKCVEVEWNKAESGACYVKYEVIFIDASSNILAARAGYNIHKLKICNLNVYTSATSAQLKASFKGTEKASEIPITPPAPTGTSMKLFLLFHWKMFSEFL